MLRKIVRDGIRAAARDENPAGTRWKDGTTIRTFTQDVVLAIQPAGDPDADRRLLRATGRTVIGTA